MLLMPGKSYKGPLPPLTPDQARLRERLHAHVVELSEKIGERNLAHYEALAQAQRYVAAEFVRYGWTPEEEAFQVDGKTAINVVCEVRGTTAPGEIVIIGAHYDSALGTPGANDNASGVAALLEIAGVLARKKPARTLRFVAFVNEELPYFQGEGMGSLEHARRAKGRGDDVVAMISLETIGYYLDRPKSQLYPAPFGRFYPDTGNFVAFVSDLRSRPLLSRALGAFRRHAAFPSEGVASPAYIPGIAWSDQWAFWKVGYPGIMVTDTAPFRYPHYHQPTDTPDKIDYDRLARVVEGLVKMVEELAESDRK